MAIQTTIISEYRQQILYIYLPVILLMFIPVWIFFIAPTLKKLPSDFTYSANILSLDNFYNEKLKRFEGQHISKTTFTYQVIKRNRNSLIILNSFQVRSIDDKHIFTANREYFIDALHWQHMATSEKNRMGYLFGPQYANKKNYNYWHINYDAPATLIFQNEETINGLSVYRYEAQYKADQSKELSYLRGVPNDRGILTKVKLQVWIEPISGWMVKYQDNSIAYWYDRRSGKLLWPWNQFSNSYTLNSISKQVENATKQKWKILAIDIFIPGFLVLLASRLIAAGFLKSSTILHKKIRPLHPYTDIRYIGYGLILLVVIGFFITGDFILSLNEKKQKYTIGIAAWNADSLNNYIAGFKEGLKERGFTVDKNLELKIQNANSNIENQITIIQNFVKQNVNLILSLTTPGTLIAKGVTTEIPIVFADVTYPHEAGIITAERESQNNLVGIRNYISAAQQFHELEKIIPTIKILGFVHRKDDPDSNFQFLEFKSALAKRNINVVEIAAIDLLDLENQLKQNNRYDAVFLACDTLAQEGADKVIANLSRSNKIPSLSCDTQSVLKGVLLSYSADSYDMGKKAGIKAALILQGSDPSWLHTNPTDKGYLNINTTTAKTMGIHIPIEMEKEAKTLFK